MVVLEYLVSVLREVLMYWMSLILGIWVFISPWLLNFSSNAAALWSNLLTGLVLVIISIYGLTISEN